jgi:hypothetical protein
MIVKRFLQRRVGQGTSEQDHVRRIFKTPARQAAVRSATRRLMNVTFADGRELMSAECFMSEAYAISPTHRL